jgi:hypothetical protein
MATYVILTDGISKYSTDYVPSGIAYSAQQNLGTLLRLGTTGPLSQTAKAALANGSTPSTGVMINADGYTNSKRTYYSQIGTSGGNTKILLHFNSITGETFIDECGNDVTIRADAFSLWTPPFTEANQLREGKFGNAWLLRPADSTVMVRVAESADFILGVDDFCIHYLLNLPTTYTYLDLHISISFGGLNIAINPNHATPFTVTAYNNADGTQYQIALGPSDIPSSSNPIHFAIQRNGSTFSVAINGVLKGSANVGSVAFGYDYSYIYTKYPVDISPNFIAGTPDSDILLEEFVFIKGQALWATFPFTPPTEASSLTGSPIMGDNIIGAIEPEPIAINPPFVIGNADFAFEIDVKLYYLYEWITYTDGTPNTQVQYYGIVGQFEQDGEGNYVDDGDYWSLYLRVNADQSIDAIFEVYISGEIVTQLIHSVDITWGELQGIVQSNEDEDFLHLAVSRQGDEARLFVDGSYSDDSRASGTLVDFSEVTGDLQINGPSGHETTPQYISPVSVKSFRMHEEAYYWADYIWEEWDENPGICVYPRIGINIMSGKAGDIRVISGLGI